jgi:hypothetical protein
MRQLSVLIHANSHYSIYRANAVNIIQPVEIHRLSMKGNFLNKSLF